ncbi:hypothetical protein R50912_09730 [Paenibacillus sp. FSL R5-0912]|nr:hypothetical protein R50912_09730 [Paenibacillus sp. FSL R5-0912]
MTEDKLRFIITVIHVISFDKDMNRCSGPLQREETPGCNFLRYRLLIYPFVAAVMNSWDVRLRTSFQQDSKNRRFMAVISMLTKDSILQCRCSAAGSV